MTGSDSTNDNRRTTRELALEMAETIERMQAAGVDERIMLRWILTAARQAVGST